VPEPVLIGVLVLALVLVTTTKKTTTRGHER
jgi:hypothetical protein